MAHGFQVVNGASQILISSETQNLHFVGKAWLSSVLAARNNYGGLRHWAFRIHCKTVPVPFFSMPVEAFYAVASVASVGTNLWEIQVIRSGTSDTAPEVYVFTTPDGFIDAPDSTYGMQVLRGDGSLSFDSRRTPLAVTGGGLVAPPNSPINPEWTIGEHWDSIIEIQEYYYFLTYAYWYNWAYRVPRSVQTMLPRNTPALAKDRGTGDASEFLSPTSYTPHNVSIGAGNSKPIYFFPSLAQATRVYNGVYAPSSSYRCISNYWVIYRGGIRYSAGRVDCGWVSCVVGNYWRAKRKDGGISIGGGIDASSIVSAGSGGQPPYVNETLNMVPTAIIIGNGSRYD